MPRVLIIGDSISIGHFKPLQKLLEGKAVVEHVHFTEAGSQLLAQ